MREQSGKQYRAAAVNPTPAGFRRLLREDAGKWRRLVAGNEIRVE